MATERPILKHKREWLLPPSPFFSFISSLSDFALALSLCSHSVTLLSLCICSLLPISSLSLFSFFSLYRLFPSLFLSSLRLLLSWIWNDMESLQCARLPVPQSPSREEPKMIDSGSQALNLYLHIYTLWLCPKWQPFPYIVNYFDQLP